MILPLKTWIEATLAFAEQTCLKCGCELELHWFTGDKDESTDPLVWYVRCDNPNCRSIYSLEVHFICEDEVDDV